MEGVCGVEVMGKSWRRCSREMCCTAALALGGGQPGGNIGDDVVEERTSIMVVSAAIIPFFCILSVFA